MKKCWMLAVAAAAILVIGACSSDKTSSIAPTSEALVASTTTETATSTHPAKASYIAQATAICSNMNAQAATLSQRYEAGQKTRETTAALYREQSSIIKSTVAELQALPRPQGDEAELEAAYEAAAQIPSAAIAVADALERGDVAEARRLGAIADRVTAAANDAADAYGLTECGSGTSDVTV
jgi:hypothetical protein